MSRSHKHTPVTGHTLAKSQKAWKRQCAGERRALERRWLHDALQATESAQTYADPWDEPAHVYRPAQSDILAFPRGNPRCDRGEFGPCDGKTWLPEKTRFPANFPQAAYSAHRAKSLRK